MRRVKEPAPRRRWRHWMFWRSSGRAPWLTLGVLGTLAVASTVAWGIRQEWPRRAMDWTTEAVVDLGADSGLAVRDVLVIGRVHTPKAAVMEALAVERGGPILDFDPKDARERLTALPWIDDASVERILPDTIVVRLMEREPIALWQHKQTYQLVDASGRVMAIKDPSAFATLPLVVGEGAPSETSDLLAILTAEPELFAMVSAAVRVSDRRWNVHLSNGADVLLPESDPAEAWRRLATYQRTYGILTEGLRTVDLRFADRVIVRPAAPASPAATSRTAPRA